MPQLIIEQKENDLEFTVFKKTCEVLINNAYNELKSGKDVKPTTTTSSIIADGKVIKVCVYTELLGEI